MRKSSLNCEIENDNEKKCDLIHLFCIFRQAHHQQQQQSQHSSHIASGHHSGSGTTQSSHIDAKYSDSVNGDTLTDFVTFVCQETDNSPQSSQVISNKPPLDSGQCWAKNTITMKRSYLFYSLSVLHDQQVRNRIIHNIVQCYHHHRYRPWHDRLQ